MKKIILPLLFTLISFNLIGQTSLTNTEKQEIVNRHNYYRQEQGAIDIQWSDELEKNAQEWVLVVAKKDRMIHSTMDFGENIYVTSAEVSPAHVVDRWASEKQFYHGEKITSQNYHLFGHYTQLIWNSTIKIGCAKAKSKTGRIYWICEYSPAGNYLNETPVKNYKD